MTPTTRALQDHAAAGWVGYGDFGAEGDGVTDDSAAIAATHAYANEHGLVVRADDHATYYLGGKARTAIVQTSTDFGTAHFLIDDRSVEDPQAPIFDVCSAAEPFEIDGVASLARGQSTLPVALPGPCHVVALDDQVRQFIRWGANQDAGAVQKDVFAVSADGSVDPGSPIIWDFERVSSLTARPIDSDELQLTGGRFTTIANQEDSSDSYHTYYLRNIRIRRSRVVVAGLVHDVIGEGDQGAPYDGILYIAQCANVTVRDCRFTGRKAYETIGSAGRPVLMGSYDIVVNDALDVSFVDCIQTNDINDATYWGVFGSNHCKNLVLDGCTFSRFDAHRGVVNVTIRNSTLGYMGIHAIGEGTVLVENTTSYGRYFLQLRPDYGSTWHGEVIIRDCTFVPLAGAESRCVLIVAANTGRHDFGYPCAMPRRFVFTNLAVDDSHHPADDPGPVIFSDVNPDRVDDSYHEEFPYPITEQVVLDNVTTTSGRALRLSDNPYLFADVTLTTS